MEKSIFNRRLFFAVLTIFIFVFALQMTEPASAAKAKLFDKGKKTFYDNYYKRYYTSTWKSYKKTNFVSVKFYFKWKDYYKKYPGTYALKKVSKTKLKIVENYYGKHVYYKKTRLSAYQYYKKHFNKKGKAGFWSVTS